MNIGLRKEAELVRCPQVDNEVFIVWVEMRFAGKRSLLFPRSCPTPAMTSELIKSSSTVCVFRAYRADCWKAVLSCSLSGARELLADLKDPAIVV